MNPLNLLPWWAKLLALGAIVGAVVAAVSAYNGHEREIGRKEVRAEWAADKLAQTKADFHQSEINTRETARRMEAQRINQERQNAELEATRDAAARNAADAERVRQQSATAADLWSHTLRNSPTQSELAAAADAIRVQADVLGRADRRAGVLAAYADSARAAGLKCERDYDALTQ